MHQWGIAFDFYRNDGKGAYNESGNFFENVGQIGKTLGLEWGGDWTSPVDRPHFQLPDWGSTPSILKKRYGNFDTFKKTWGNQESEPSPAKDSWMMRLQQELIRQGYDPGTADGIARKYAPALHLAAALRVLRHGIIDGRRRAFILRGRTGGNRRKQRKPRNKGKHP